MNHSQPCRPAAGAAIEGEPLAFASKCGVGARERDGAFQCLLRLCIAQYSSQRTFVNESRNVSRVLRQETLSSRKWARGGAVA